VENKLEQAWRRVLTGRGIVANQKLQVATIKAEAGDSTSADGLLRQHERNQVIFEEDLEELLRKTRSDSGA
jgi:hypothetical protein